MARCCNCGYNGQEETSCFAREDKLHCACWYDGDSVTGHPTQPHALTREQCSLCTANRPRLCDQHYKQGADELLKHVTAAIQDQQTPGGVKATYEQLLELCNQQRQALAQQAQEIERLKKERARMTAERDEAVDETTSLRASCHAFDLQVQELQATLAAREAKYQKTISESIDQIDLQCDEFNRIKAITDNEEIKGICDRAVRDIGQRVPVIQQRDAAVQDAARLREALEVERAKRGEAYCLQEKERILSEFCLLQVKYGEQKHEIRNMAQEIERLKEGLRKAKKAVSERDVARQDAARLREALGAVLPIAVEWCSPEEAKEVAAIEQAQRALKGT